jgi:hypothetical protein
MTSYLGLSWMWWALFLSYGLIAFCSMSLFWLADRADARRRRSPPVVIQVGLPRAVQVATKWRRERW